MIGQTTITQIKIRLVGNFEKFNYEANDNSKVLSTFAEWRLQMSSEIRDINLAESGAKKNRMGKEKL